MSDERKDLPSVSAPNFDERVRESLQTYLGTRGNVLDRGLTLRDLKDAGIIKLRAGLAAGGTSGGTSRPVAGPGVAVQATYEADLTPPPTPSGFNVGAAISNLFIGHDAPVFTQGHGYARTIVYGATRATGAPAPVFADAVEITQFVGQFHAYPTNPATVWHLWIKYKSVDGVLSVAPAGGTNGLSTTTGQDVSSLVRAMTGPGNPFTILAVDTTIDGRLFPAGTYSTQAFIIDAQITNAKIANLAVDNAKIANLSVSTAKITDAAITSAKILDANITTAKIETAAITTALINDAAITTAKIGDATITTAKIGDLQVDTLKIANSAVTESQGAVFLSGGNNFIAANYGTFFYNGTNRADAALSNAQELLSITLNTGGAPVVVLAYAGLSRAGAVALSHEPTLGVWLPVRPSRFGARTNNPVLQSAISPANIVAGRAELGAFSVIANITNPPTGWFDVVLGTYWWGPQSDGATAGCTIGRTSVWHNVMQMIVVGLKK